MDFSKIIGTQGEDDLFEFKYKDIPDNTTHHSEVYLVLKDGKTLDFETTFVYSFSIQPAVNLDYSYRIYVSFRNLGRCKSSNFSPE